MPYRYMACFGCVSHHNLRHYQHYTSNHIPQGSTTTAINIVNFIKRHSNVWLHTVRFVLTGGSCCRRHVCIVRGYDVWHNNRCRLTRGLMSFRSRSLVSRGQSHWCVWCHFAHHRRENGHKVFSNRLFSIWNWINGLKCVCERARGKERDKEGERVMLIHC